MEPEILAVVSQVHSIFKDKGLTLSVAESCTGGLISHYITSIPGASIFFKTCIVAYSEEVKKSMLGISSDTIERFGVVSDETGREMAEKVRLLSKADYAISTTGNLGPDSLEEKGRGLIYIAVSMEGKTVSKELRLKGNREGNKAEAALAAFKLLIDVVEKNA